MKFTCIMVQPSRVSWYSLHMCHGTAFTCIMVQPSHASRYRLHMCHGTTFTCIMVQPSHLSWYSLHMYWGTTFTKMWLFFHILLHYKHIFFQLCIWYHRPDAYSFLLKHLSSSGMLNFHSSSSAKQHPQGASFSGPKRWKTEMTNSDCREDKGEQSTPPLQLPPLCTNWSVAWHCHAAEKLDSSSVWLHPANLLF